MNKLYYIPIILVCIILLVSTLYQVNSPAQTCLYTNTSTFAGKIYGSIIGPFNAYTETTLPNAVSYQYNLFYTVLVVLLFLPLSYVIKRPKINLFLLGIYITQLIIAPFYLNSTKCFQGGTSLFSVDIIFTAIVISLLFLVQIIQNLPARLKNKRSFVYVFIILVYIWRLSHYPYQEHIFGLGVWLMVLFGLIISDTIFYKVTRKPYFNFFKRD